MGWNPVDDLVVDADTCASGEAGISEEGRFRAAFQNVGVNNGIQFLRGDTRANGVACNKQRLARDSPRFLHQQDLLGFLEYDRHIRSPEQTG